MSFEIAIKVDNLSKCYQIYDKPRDRLMQMLARGRKRYFREFWALRDVSFEIRRGQTVGIIGRNGSGKSTLLQMICGTLAQSSGSIVVNGRVAALLELGSGFNPEFTGSENVYMNAALLGLTREQIDARYDRIVEFADIGQFIDQPVKTYSSGMIVRLAFAVIAHVDADILVIDEALAVGDAFFVQKCMRFLRTFMEKGTVLFVSHDTGAVLNLCQHAVWLGAGEMRAQGEPKDVAAAYLKDLYESLQGGDAAVDDSSSPKAPSGPAARRDMREDFINASPYRNDIELFEFRPESDQFGKRGALIEGVRLLDSASRPLAWAVGGEEVILSISCKAMQMLAGVIVGFQVKDRLGQVVFADNTYLTYAKEPRVYEAGEVFDAAFHFAMPLLPTGDYVIGAAIAEGTQADHVQHHWLHDALAFRVHASRICFGIFGVPMSRISIESRQ
ncbi:ABC transporter ATP-binding protein [Bordetella flabilis]|uniref:ABC transporter ATP-binding protein n=1 Tax=Bordetella flabilis TaxID=463014 RepID=A0A193GIL3_9BORD|nr:ABC transporter ATP-binding protein [Bordetella flabilis]ANN79917.1 ABC transporter ATP-binding protein [Bordetella flabilis]